MIKTQGIVLLVGATGKTGIHVARQLIKRRMPVRIIVRNRKTVTDQFGQMEVAFESIRQCKDFNSPQGIAQIRKAFQDESPYGKVTMVVSALGATRANKREVEKIEYDAQKILIDFSKEFGINKYVFVTAAFMTRAWNLIPLMLSLFVPNVYAQKAKAENYLRKSGLNYTIIRPGGLRGGYEESEPTAITLNQGDTESGSITRSSVASLVVDCLVSQTIKPKVTVGCYSTKEQFHQAYNMTAGDLTSLKEDTERDMVTANHHTSLNTLKFGIAAALMLGVAKLTSLWPAAQS